MVSSCQVENYWCFRPSVKSFCVNKNHALPGEAQNFLVLIVFFENILKSFEIYKSYICYMILYKGTPHVPRQRAYWGVFHHHPDFQCLLATIVDGVHLQRSCINRTRLHKPSSVVRLLLGLQGFPILRVWSKPYAKHKLVCNIQNPLK